MEKYILMDYQDSGEILREIAFYFVSKIQCDSGPYNL